MPRLFVAGEGGNGTAESACGLVRRMRRGNFRRPARQTGAGESTVYSQIGLVGCKSQRERPARSVVFVSDRGGARWMVEFRSFVREQSEDRLAKAGQFGPGGREPLPEATNRRSGSCTWIGSPQRPSLLIALRLARLGVKSMCDTAASLSWFLPGVEGSFLSRPRPSCLSYEVGF